jgi:methylenetetrahydrofolate dehydrogenase (NADP+)/methenyltetrahydrofolate cyclohydrolase
MKVFDGKFFAPTLEEKIKDYLGSHKVFGILAIVQIGSNPSSEKYISLKKKLCDKLGIKAEVYQMEDSLSDDELKSRIKKLFEDESVTGGIIQLPLPRASLKPILDLIPTEKDIDLLSSASKERFYNGDFSRLSPILRALDYFLKNCDIDIEDKKVIVIGDGELVGKPTHFYLSRLGANSEIINSYKTGQKLDCDLLILSAGIPYLVDGEDVSEGCSVVDFGSSVVNEKTAGDLDSRSKLDHLAFVSPSPGGVGPLVVRFLVMNFLNI